MTDHGARSHATWSASSTARNWACPGALTLAGQIEQPPESLAAAWGTACHQLAERCLRGKANPMDYIGEVEQTQSFSIEVDEELAQCAQDYVDYVREASRAADWVKIEERFSLETVKPPFDAGGTADAVVYTSALKLLEVIDLKGGRGVRVDAKENPQGRTYALGALLAHPGLDVDKVQVTIVQPRVSRTPKVEIIHVADLIEWANDLKAKMYLADQARRELQVCSPDVWEDRWLRAGDHCSKTFCPAMATCPAARKKALAEARVWFSPEGDMQRPNSPDTFPPEELAKILDAADMIQDWLNAVRAYAHAQAEGGVVIPGYQLADKRAIRKWSAPETEVLSTLFLMADLLPDDVYAPRKLKSPAQIEKMLGGPKKAGSVLDSLYSKESSGTNLVAVGKTDRPAVTPSVNQFFTAEKDA